MTDFRALCVELYAAFNTYAVDEPHHDLLVRARAALAQPEPQKVTDEELLGIEDLQATWNAQADAFNSWDELGIDEIVWWAQRQALARWSRPAIEPVPVSEGLPGPKDCDAEGRCWGLANTPHLDGCCYKTWKLVPCSWVGPGNTSTHWLPHWALPVPKVNNTGKTND